MRGVGCGVWGVGYGVWGGGFGVWGGGAAVEGCVRVRCSMLPAPLGFQGRSALVNPTRVLRNPLRVLSKSHQPLLYTLMSTLPRNRKTKITTSKLLPRYAQSGDAPETTQPWRNCVRAVTAVADSVLIPHGSTRSGDVLSSANMAHVRQSRPDPGLGFQVKVVSTFEVVPSSLGSGRVYGSRCRVLGCSLFARQRSGCAAPPLRAVPHGQAVWVVRPLNFKPQTPNRSTQFKPP